MVIVSILLGVLVGAFIVIGDLKNQLIELRDANERQQELENAMRRWIRKHRKKLDRLSRTKRWDFHWEEQYNAERAKVAGYEQLAKVHSAYITILLKELGATEENMITITPDEVTEALQRYEARAVPNGDGSFSLYCEVTSE